MTDIKVDFKALLAEEKKNHRIEVGRLSAEIKELQGMVLYERERRQYAEKRLLEYENEYEYSQKSKRRRKSKVKSEALNKPREYSEYKSNGVRKKSKVNSIASYTDFKKIQDYFKNTGNIVGYALWTSGVCMGVRISDLNTLKWKNILNIENFSFKERIKIYEKKTNKLQNCLITDAMVYAFTSLLNSLEWKISPDDYVFANPETSKPYNESTWYRHINAAAKSGGITYNVGTHTMRESFANIVLCVDKGTVDMNAITKIQGLLNHSDPRVTLKYLGKLDEMYDNARKTVSDFIMGKTGVDKLECGSSYDFSDVIKTLDNIVSKFDR